MFQFIEQVRKFVIVLFAIFISFSLAADLNEACITPKNETGTCTYFNNCEELYKIVKSANTTQADQAFLRSSQCGLDVNQTEIARRVLVCCPSNSTNISSRETKDGKDFGNVLPEPGVCGPDFNTRIYGGNVTRIDEFPWMALIQYRKSKIYFGFHCGGALINSRYVLTAGHCIENPDMPPTWEIYAVRLGEWDLSEPIDCETDVRGDRDCAPPFRDVIIEKTIIHENYIPGSPEQYNDIALIRLSETITPYNDFIRPICLPLDTSIRNSLQEGVQVTVSGWGTTEIAASSDKKLKAEIPVWNTSLCAEKFLTYKLHINNDYQLCAGGLRGIDACRGDSGGPLMVQETINKRKVYFTVGIVSYGPRPCGLNGWPGVYTKIDYFIDWIQKSLEP